MLVPGGDSAEEADSSTCSKAASDPDDSEQINVSAVSDSPSDE